jgi:hypothetical protein
MELTPTQQLAGLLLRKPILEWTAEQRAAGLSWERIARILEAETDRKVTITGETLRAWMADE